MAIRKFVLCALLSFMYLAAGSDITNQVFGHLTDGMPAAFGDFNSDELTDVFVLRDGGKTLEIFLAAEEEPLLRVARPKPLRYLIDVSEGELSRCAVQVHVQ